MAELIPILQSVQLHTTTATLVDGTDFLINADPTAGDMILTLPDAATATRSIFLKRISNGNNTVSIKAAGSDAIDDTVNGYMFSLINEFLELYPDGGTVWRIKGKDLFAICTMTATAASFAATTSLVKFDGWDTDVFSTPGKLIADLVNSNVEVAEFQGPVADGYEVNVTFNCEFTNNKIVIMQLYIGGELAGIPVSVNALGAGKPVTLPITQQIAATAVTDLELHVSVETAATITDINALIQIKRIGR